MRAGGRASPKTGGLTNRLDGATEGRNQVAHYPAAHTASPTAAQLRQGHLTLMPRLRLETDHQLLRRAGPETPTQNPEAVTPERAENRLR